MYKLKEPIMKNSFNEEIKNVIAYTRVSTDGQVGEDKFGLESQKRQIEEYCAKNDMTIVDWVSDEGVSGAKWRDGFDSIVYGEVHNPPVQAVIVAKSDRVARDINIYFSYQGMLLRKNIELISVTEDFGQFGVFANALKALTLTMAEMERENITKRTMGGRKVKASMGGYSGGRCPVGYRVQNGRLIIDPEEAEVVKRIFRRTREGAKMLKIANELNADGVKTRSGGRFYASQIKSILDNEKLYRGYYRYGNENWVKGQHVPILNEDDIIEKDPVIN